jgi:uncharacterized membrane protein YjfL (UPF0719 family)
MFETIVQQVLYGATYLLIAYALLYLNKVGSDWYAKSKGLDNDHAIEEESNLAVALRKSGLYLGIMLGMYGVISGPSAGYFKDVFDIITYGVIVSIFFGFARTFNDFVVLGRMGNTEQVKRGNIAVGLVEFGAFIATGIIAMSTMIGEGGGYIGAILFFIFGQIVLLLVTVIYEWVTPWHVKAEIKNGNAAAGLRLGGLMVAVAIAISGAVATDFVSWDYNLMVLGVNGVLAVFFMVLISFGIDRFFFGGTDIQTEIVRDKNIAAIGVVTALQIAGGFAISAAIV